MRINAGFSSTESSADKRASAACMAASLAIMRGQHHRHCLARGAAALQHGFEADGGVAQHRRHVGDDARSVEHHQPQVIGAAVLRCMGRAGAWLSADLLGAPDRRVAAAGDVDQVCHHGTRGGAGPRAAALQHHPANRVALRHHGVEHAIDARNRRV